LSGTVANIITKHQEKAFIYTIASNPLTTAIDEAQSSTDFYNFTFKYGVNIDETLCKKAVFIVNKDGEIVYREVLDDPSDDFDSEILDKALDEAIKFKKKGHTHETWMSV
jgi:thiol peroxidase